MPANFQWETSRSRIVESAQNALRDVGYVLHARRLHLHMSEKEIAVAASAALGQQGAITQPMINALEEGKLPPLFHSSYDEINAVLSALQWRKTDIKFMGHMIKEFARID